MKTINNRHLASHNITGEEYKRRFPGSTFLSEESAHKLSERSIKSNASRKGVPRTDEEKAAMRAGQVRVADRPRRHFIMTEEQKRKISETKKQRFRDGTTIHPNLDRHHSEETKERISQALSGVAQGPERALKAIETKRALGYDLGKHRGFTHSDETKTIIGQKSTEYYNKIRPILREPMLERISTANLTLLNDITDYTFLLRCNVCNYEFHRNHHMFHPAKYRPTICDQCFPISKTSAAERDIKEMIERWLPDTTVIGSDMEQIAPLELDIYIPSLHIAIEYNGLYRHSELAGKSRWYHRHKFEACKTKGIKLITIFEDEWTNNRDIVESMLWNALRLNTYRLNARDCSVVTLSTEMAASFLDKHHIQGHGRSSLKYGLMHHDELVSVMTFSNGEVSRKMEGWEINRFATAFDTSVRGGASKLFSAFLRDRNPTKVTSYADLRYGNGNVYQNLGFSLSGLTVPGYWYFKNTEIKRFHRFTLRKTPNDPSHMTEWETRREQGWNRIWDCGHAKWVFESK
jgi:hypothetical protein